MYSSYQSERQGLILSISELSEQSQLYQNGDDRYATRQQAFYDQSIFSFVVDEVHAMMQIMCCENRFCGNFYNPIYLIVFCSLFVTTFPGALLHWLCICWVPVRYREFPEERELRSQGIYTAMGIALWSVPASIWSYITDTESLAYISQISIILN
eukprot:gene5216-7258_t